MYKISNKEFDNNVGMETLMKDIKTYLHKQQLVIIDDNGIPISEEAMNEILRTNPSYSFSTKDISLIESEFIFELINYIDIVEVRLNELSASNNSELIINGFIDLINSLIEIQGTARYYNIQVVEVDYVNDLAKRAVTHIQKGDSDFILDVMEYELIPLLLEFKNKLPERQH